MSSLQDLAHEVTLLLPDEGLASLSASTGEAPARLREGFQVIIPAVMAALALHARESSPSTLERIQATVSDLCVLFGSPVARPRPWRDAPRTVQWDDLLRDPQRMLLELAVPGTPATSMASQLLNQIFSLEWDKVLRGAAATANILPETTMVLATMSVPMVFSWLSGRVASAGGVLSLPSLQFGLKDALPDPRSQIPMHLSAVLLPKDLLSSEPAPTWSERGTLAGFRTGVSERKLAPERSRLLTEGSTLLTSFLSLLLFLSLARIFYPWDVGGAVFASERVQAVTAALQARWQPVAHALSTVAYDTRSLLSSVGHRVGSGSFFAGNLVGPPPPSSELSALGQPVPATAALNVGDQIGTRAGDLDVRAMLRMAPEGQAEDKRSPEK